MALSYMWAYEAPSLVPQIPWKRSQASKVIDINNGFDFGVTPNLYAALLQLRSRPTSTFIWIDQICIDQADQNEKIYQIALMGRIYQMATKTIVWLGPKNYQSVCGLKGLRTILNRVNCPDSKPINLFWKHVQYWELLLGISAFFGLLRNPYFTRVWIVQEMALSREVEIWCGDDCVPLQNLAAIAGATTTIDIGSRQAKNLLKILGVRCHIFGDEAPSMQNAGWIIARDLTKDMFSILSLFRNNRATVMRDQIYGFLGLCRAIGNGQDFGITEETSSLVTCQQVYTGAAKAMLKGRRNLDMFSALRFQMRARNHEHLPSWVPDWSDNQHVTIPISSLYEDLEAYEPEYTWGSADHSNVSLMNVLKLFGHEVDSIEALGDPCNTELASPSVKLCLESIYTAAGTHRMQTFSDWWKRFNVCRADTESIVSAITCGRYRKESLESVIRLVDRYQQRATKAFSKTTFGLLVFMVFEFLLELYILPGMTVLLYFVIPQCLAVPLTLYCLTYSCLRVYPYILIFNTDPWESEFYNVGLDRIEGRKIARTRRGRFALVPQEATDKDRIFVCAGGRCPLVLRNTSETVDRDEYHIIGECYVDEVMKENIGDEDRLIRIV
ncbi:hypothetical protein VTL71DRAFT_9433 [Oculimacula yallundae]|uniref:Heterokaryon incompatibility domain-containing protein n=1 Tax=Oculimacula yallundae TaxID=86028 RepID=A0ABR4BRV6_9HELO